MVNLFWTIIGELLYLLLLWNLRFRSHAYACSFQGGLLCKFVHVGLRRTIKLQYKLQCGHACWTMCISFCSNVTPQQVGDYLNEFSTTRTFSIQKWDTQGFTNTHKNWVAKIVGSNNTGTLLYVSTPSPSSRWYCISSIGTARTTYWNCHRKKQDSARVWSSYKALTVTLFVRLLLILHIT